MKKFTIPFVLSSLLLSLPFLSEAQVVAMPVAPACLIINKNLTYGMSDPEVAKLQQFLNVTMTGYFGPLTLKAVQKWQKENNVVSSGSPSTTGYGRVGAFTRAKLKEKCQTSEKHDYKFSASPAIGSAPLKVSFSAVPEPGVSSESYYISLGDGVEYKLLSITCDASSIAGPCPTLMTLSHTFSQAGTYEVGLEKKYSCPPGSEKCIALYSEKVASVTVTIQ